LIIVEVVQSQTVYRAIDAGIRGAFFVDKFFGKPMNEIGLEYKHADGDTPRTIIDREAGNAIVNYLREYFPKDAINEEESGQHAGHSSFRWHVDPYDGTSNASILMDLSTVGIALEYDNEIITGVVIDPFRHKGYAAEKGAGAYEFKYNFTPQTGDLYLSDMKKLKVSSRAAPKERYAEIDGLFNTKTTGPKTGFISDLAKYVQNFRMTGSNIRSAANLASQGTDIWLIDAVGGYFDIAPGAVLIPEAGGIITGLESENPWNGMQVAIATNNVGDHDEIRELAKKRYAGYKGFR